LVVWTLTTVTGGTQLHLKHHQYSYTAAIASFNRAGIMVRSYSNSGLFHVERFPGASASEILAYHSNLGPKTRSTTSTIATTLELPEFQLFTWDYFLNQTLPQLLSN